MEIHIPFQTWPNINEKAAHSPRLHESPLHPPPFSVARVGRDKGKFAGSDKTKRFPGSTMRFIRRTIRILWIFIGTIRQIDECRE